MLVYSDSSNIFLQSRHCSQPDSPSKVPLPRLSKWLFLCQKALFIVQDEHPVFLLHKKHRRSQSAPHA